MNPLVGHVQPDGQITTKNRRAGGGKRLPKDQASTAPPILSPVGTLFNSQGTSLHYLLDTSWASKVSVRTAGKVEGGRTRASPDCCSRRLSPSNLSQIAAPTCGEGRMHVGQKSTAVTHGCVKSTPDQLLKLCALCVMAFEEVMNCRLGACAASPAM